MLLMLNGEPLGDKYGTVEELEAHINGPESERPLEISFMDSSYSITFKDGPLGLCFRKEPTGEFLVDWVVGQAEVLGVSSYSRILSINDDPVGNDLDENSLIWLIKCAPRPLTIRFDLSDCSSSHAESDACMDVYTY
jgi:hypothetical protein